MLTILQGHCLEKLRELPDQSVQCCITSPPYWGLRDYGLEPVMFGDGWSGQLGLEPRPELFVAHLVEIFREARRVLKDDGTLWLNLGDSYSGSGRGTGEQSDSSRGTNRTRLANGRGDQPSVQRNKEPVLPSTAGSQLPAGMHENARQAGQVGRAWVPPPPGLKNKDLVGIPWMAAFALRADGWYLRSGIPWLKRSCMPESVTDRPTTAMEYVFLLSKTDDYYFDKEAVLMPLASSSETRLAQDVDGQTGSARANGGAKTNGGMKAVASGKNERSGLRRYEGFNARWDAKEKAAGKHADQDEHAGQKRLIDGVKEARANGGDHDNPFGPRRNIRNSDWFFKSLEGLLGNEDGEPLAFIVNPKGYKGAHFATWPPKLVRPMVLASCPPGGVVLDLFGGSGTTGMVALENGREAVLIEMNPAYVDLIRQRCETTGGLPLA